MRPRLWMLAWVPLIFCGCATKSAEAPRVVSPDLATTKTVCAGEKSRRIWTEKQLDALRSFALAESPGLWQTVQMLKAEKASRKAALEALCKEMKEFGRNPNIDPDVAALKSAYEDLDGSLVTVYQKLEEAYIAYKKMQATPGRKEYADMMRSALEEGIQEAETTVARYREMSKTK